MSIVIEKLQDTLNFKGCTGSPQFNTKNSLGRIGTTGYLLGIVGGFHIGLLFTACIFSSVLENSDLLSALMIWSIYMIFLCSFHFLEFFSTSLGQPDSLNYDSFMGNTNIQYYYSFSFI